MSSHVLSRRTINLKDLHRCYHVGKAASINTVIGRHLRKYGPQPFGKTTTKEYLASEKSKSPAKRGDYSRPRGSSKVPIDRSARSSKFNDRPLGVNSDGRSFIRTRKETGFGAVSNLGDRAPYQSQKSSFRPSSDARERSTSGSGEYPSLSPRERPFRPRSNDESENDTRSGTRQYGGSNVEFGSSYGSTRTSYDQEAGSSRSRDTSYSRDNKASFSSRESGDFSGRRTRNSMEQPHATRMSDKLPVSIPYTTPASEFLYGTSVVEAALRSQRTPRRKLYKLYIYNGENRIGANRDSELEWLARRNDVEVVHVRNEGLRLMEKLSSGRPHNGYILEASPLPRLPVQSLRELVTKKGQSGYLVTIGHQSREEAAVNGVSDFQITNSLSGKMPLVLLLDGIVDPGNVGGILRTASFLGVSAVAISTRNSAPFTPVVLKASAGASENVTLFSVSAPAGFIVDSRRAGWKIYAGVAPSNNKDPAMPRSVSTSDLGDPLSESPCILMLGSEGEGLRWNLRSKADVELYIQGCGQSHNIDSLNVSVAAGILCNAFFRGKSNVVEASKPTVETKPFNPEASIPSGYLF